MDMKESGLSKCLELTSNERVCELQDVVCTDRVNGQAINTGGLEAERVGILLNGVPV